MADRPRSPRGATTGDGSTTAPTTFIVSTGRTGTTFLATALGTLGADAHHEPGPVLLQNCSHARASGHLSDRRALALLRRWRPEIFRPPSAAGERRPYIEASLHVYGLVDVVLDHVPQARVIQIVRDPRTYVRSAMLWGVHRPDGRPQNVIPYRRANPAQHRPWHLPTRLRWMFSSQFERICWTWAEMNRTMRRQGERRAGFSTVRFEDLFGPDTGADTLRTIASTAGLDIGGPEAEDLVNTVINPASRRDGVKHPSRLSEYPAWDEWPDERKATLRRHCAAEAENYGYEL